MIKWAAQESATYYIVVYGAGAGAYELSLSFVPSALDAPLRGQIGFTSLWGGEYQIYVMNADGSEATRLTDASRPNWHPS